MRLMSLHLRSRRAGLALALLVVIVAATWLWGHVAGGDSLSLALLVVAPSLAAASVIGATMSSPIADLEATASHALPPLRLSHLGGLLVFITLGLVAVGGALDGALVRDLAGFTGLALLTARFAGSAASWSVPLTYGALAVLIGPGPWWAWPAAAATNREDVLIAATLLVVGLGVVTQWGTPYRVDDAV